MDLYPDIGCPACGERHALYHAGRRRPGDRVAYRYTCPATDAIVVYRPAESPRPVVRAPAHAIPLAWVPD